MRIVKFLLYGLFPCLLWSCEKEGTDQQYVEVPEGFALSAGTATNFLTSSKAYDFEASWLSGIYSSRFNDGDVITVEPWRSAAFPIIKDCMVDRGAFDKIIQAGGYVTVRTGQPQDANAILIPKEAADEAMDCATCIGCGACVAACKNGSAMLFVSSKVSQLALLPQGRPEAAKRAKAMIMKMEELGFGNCTNTRACEAECPKNESIANIARLNREFIKAKLAD